MPVSCLIDLIQSHSVTTPYAPAVYHRDKVLTYAQLNQAANQLAHNLLAQKVEVGQTVAVMAKRGFEQMIALLAIAKTGAAYLPLDPEMPTQRLAGILQNSGCLGCLIDASQTNRFAQPPCALWPISQATIADLAVNSVNHPQDIKAPNSTQHNSTQHNPQITLSPDQAFYLLYTSGSTGTPKGAVITRAGAENLYAWYADLAQFNAQSRPLIVSSIGFDLTQKNIWTAWRQGACVYLPNSDHYDANDLLALICSAEITHLNCTPTTMKGLMLGITPQQPLALASLRWVFLGGEALYLAPFSPWLQHPQCQAQLVNSYGPTECSDVVSYFLVPKDFPPDQQAPIGKAVPQLTLSVVDEQLQPVKVGELGECVVAGIGVGLGYPKQPKLTAEKFIEHVSLGRIYRTGDLVKELPTGDLLYAGRRDHQVKIRGFRIELGEIEQALINHPAIDDAAVIATEEASPQLAAYLVWKQQIAISVLRADLQASLPDYMLPTVWTILPSLPLNANGKVDRRALPKPKRTRPELSVAYVPPSNALEQWLAAQWRQLLQLEEVGVLDKFFELGGSSLLSIEFIGGLTQQLHVPLRMADFFAEPTLRAYSQVLLRKYREHLPVECQNIVSSTTASRARQQPNASVQLNTHQDIAIIGMAGRFPGAENIHEFWQNLLAARSGLQPVVFEALAAAGVNPALWQEANYVRWCAPLTDIENFDAQFFGYTPKEVEWMDPQQRLLLEVAWWALEDAGYDPLNMSGSVGVFTGVAHNGYLLHNLAARPELREACRDYLGLLGNEKDFPATRVAFKLNLQGPAINIQTACSSSAVALHLACQSLRQRECDAALVGGGRVLVPHRVGYLSVEGGPLSATGQTRAFDAQATGMVRGSGMSMVVLKRLDDALAAGDCIRAVIKGSAINNDGADKIGFTAPSVQGQAEVIQLALAQAGVAAQDIRYVETHGTATRLGDPIEMAALQLAHGPHAHNTHDANQNSRPCFIGSLKSNIGHLDAGAGVAGIIKTSLMLQHAQLPASLHCEQPNPEIDWQGSGFVVNTQTRPWLIESSTDQSNTDKPKRLAGVSAFGLGGTNAHIILAEPPARPTSATNNAAQLCSFSAKTPQALQTLLQNFATYLELHPDINLADLAYTLQVGRHRFAHGAHLVAKSVQDLQQQLQSISLQSTLASTQPLPWLQAAPVIFIFPGQGSQFAGMAQQLYKHQAVFKQTVDDCCQILKQQCDLDLLAVLLQSDFAVPLQATADAQLALFVVEYALAKLWQSAGIDADVMLGHSIGEWVAATLAGVFQLEDALKLVALRGKLMQALPSGAMLAVQATADQLQPYLSNDVALAAVNTPQRCVLSGSFAAIDAVQQRLQHELNLESQRLHTSHAFHSPMMQPMLAEFEAAVAVVPRKSTDKKVISSVTGQFISANDWCEAGYWSNQIRQPVQFAAAVATAQAQYPQLIWLEVGPHRVLTQGLKQSALDEKNHLILASQPPVQQVAHSHSVWLQTLGQLWQTGKSLNYAALYAEGQPLRIPLPTYAYQRHRYWIDAPAYSSTDSVTVSIPTTESAAAAPVAANQPPVDRRELISTKITTQIQQVAGMQLQPADYSESFIALGLDSLLLTQLAALLKRQFKLALGLRELMDTYPNVQALTQWIDERTADLPSMGASKPASVSQANVIASLKNTSAETGTKKTFGAQTRIQLHSQAITASEQQAITDLLESYIAKTSASKAFTAQNRAQLADPRAVSGFHPLLKEAVYPLVVKQSSGAYFTDLDQHSYVDFTSGFGAILLGHNPELVRQALVEQLADGVEIGPQHPKVAFASQAMCRMTGQERVAFCNTGSEAVMGALRIARTVTGRDRIVVFTDDYHGIFDEVIVRANPEGQGIPAVAGIPFSQTDQVWVLPYGEIDALEFIAEHADEIAAVVVEPVQSRRLNWQPRAFMRSLREVTQTQQIALIFDEVITGFRCHQGGAQAYFGVKADIATYGKIIGGGLPIGAIAGSAKFMDALDGGHWQYGDASRPEVGVTYFAGTFVRHPLTLAACCATLNFLEQQGPGLQQELNARCEQLMLRLQRLAERLQAPLKIAYFSSAWRIDWDESFKLPGLFYIALRQQGIHIYEGRTWFLTLAHGDKEQQQLLAAFEQTITHLQQAGLMPKKMPTLLSLAMPPAEVIPSTEPQQEIYASVQMGDEANCAFNESTTVQLTGQINRQAFELAVQAMLLRHPVLTAIFTAAGDQLRFAPQSQPQFEFVDLRNKPEQAELFRNNSLTKPYDLIHGPLFRVQLLQLRDEYYELLLCAHHILCDGWSYSVMVRELGHLYAAAVRSDLNPSLISDKSLSSQMTSNPVQQLAEQLPWPPQFADYAQLSFDVDARTAQQRALLYWLNQYPLDDIPQMDIPTDNPRRAERSYRAKRLDLDFGSDLVQAIRRDANQHNVSVVTWLLTSFLLVLQRWTQQDDLVIGLPASGQAASGQSQLIGHCVNVLPLRLPINSDGSVEQALQTVRQKLLDAYDHQDLTFGQLLKHLPLSRDASRIPLLPLLFNVDVMRSEPYAYPEVDVQLRVNPRQFDNFECTLNLMLSDNALQCQCTFNTDLWQQTTWQRRLTEWRELIRGLTSGSLSWQTQVGQLPLALADNNFIWQGPIPELPIADLGALMVSRCEQFAERTALIWQQPVQQYQLSYQQLQQQINRLLPQLMAIENPLIAVCLDRGFDLIVALLAVWQAGKAYVPIDPDYPVERISYMLNHAQPGLLITDSFRSDSFSELIKTCPVLCIDQLDMQAITEPVFPVAPSTSLAYVIYTSGSTGTPKGVEVTRASVVNFLQSMQRQPGLISDDVLVAVTTISFDIAVLELFLPLWVGAKVVIADRASSQDGKALQQLLQDSKATVLQATPTTWQMLLAAGWVAPTGFKALCGGEAMPANLAANLLEKGCVLWNMYGPTETTVWSACWQITSAEQVNNPGLPLDHTQLAVLDKHQQPSLVGAYGELYIGGVGLAAGYRDQPQLTAEKFVELELKSPQLNHQRQRWYRTGDRVQITYDQRLRFIGRIDNQIKLRGFRIELGEIENQIRACTGIETIAVSLIKVTEQDLRLVAFYEQASLNIPDQTIDLAAIRQQLQKHLPIYMLPSHWQALPLLPRLPNGKLNRHVLADLVIWPSSTSAKMAWQNPAENYLASIWQQVLVRNDIGRDDNFFQLGGHSLLAMQAIARIQQEQNIKMTLREWVLMDLKTLVIAYPALQDRLQPASINITDEFPVVPNSWLLKLRQWWRS